MGQESLLKDLGPCSVEFNGVNVGTSKGGITFRDTTNQQAIMEDQAGSTPVDHVITGRTIEVEVLLSRVSLAQLSKVIPGASSFGSYIKVNNEPGTTRFSGAQKLVLAPVVNGSDSADKLTIFKAAPRTEIELVFDNEGQRVYKVVFTGYPDSSNNNQLYQIGNAP